MTREWHTQPAAEHVLGEWLSAATRRDRRIGRLKDALLGSAGVRLRDIVDHIVAPPSAIAAFAGAGWARDGTILRNEAGLFPPVLTGSHPAIFIRVESIETCLAACGTPASIA